MTARRRLGELQPTVLRRMPPRRCRRRFSLGRVFYFIFYFYQNAAAVIVLGRRRRPRGRHHGRRRSLQYTVYTIRLQRVKLMTRAQALAGRSRSIYVISRARPPFSGVLFFPARSRPTHAIYHRRRCCHVRARPRSIARRVTRRPYKDTRYTLVNALLYCTVAAGRQGRRWTSLFPRQRHL